MAKILLDYVFPISVIAPTPQASTAFLKQVCVIAKPNEANEENVGTITLCTTAAAVAELTANTNASQLFNAGMNRVYVLLSDDLDVAEALDENQGVFFTVLISDDFGNSDLATLDLGTFKGVTGLSSTDKAVVATQAAIENRCAFFTNSTNKAKNLFYAFGSLLSNQLGWNSQQYITMPFNDGVDTLGDAEELFDGKVSFVISDDEFSTRLALFACGRKAITAPYIIKNLCIDLQSRALQWISGNQPKYTLKEAALLETRLQEDVVQSFITRNWIDAGIVEIKLEAQNFVASGYINVAEPKALWRVISELKQTL
jgi:hypothetical protein